MVGDIFFNEEDPIACMADIKKITTAADVMIGNLEMPVCDPLPQVEGKPGGRGKRLWRSPPSSIVGLSEAGFHAVSLANNHSFNYGLPGLEQMCGLLDGLHIAHTGGGRNVAQAHEPAIVTSRGLRCALLSYTSVYARNVFEATDDCPGLATVRVDTRHEPHARFFEVPGMPAVVHTSVDPHDAERVRADIRAARQRVDVVVVAWHWGISGGYRKLVPYQTELAHLAIDAGATVVFGHHPHCLQPIEFHGEGVVCYSAGNFAFAMGSSTRLDPESVVLDVRVTPEGRLDSVHVHPTWFAAPAHPVPLDADDPRVSQVLQRLGAGDSVEFEAAGANAGFRAHPRAINE
jgi:poly-gamma-glutamate synthesis protein (capsule biosynthesis protein)